MFGITRDRLVVEFKGGDRVYVDSEDIGLIRKYTGGEEPKLSKMGGADWEKTRAQVRKAVRDIAARARRAVPPPPRDARPRVRGRRSVPDSRSRTRSRTRRRPTRRKAIDETKADMERPIPMDRLDLRRRRLRQDRGRAACRGQGGVRRQAGRDPRAHHAAREPARPDVPRALRELSGARRGAVAVPDGEGTERGRAGRAATARSTSSSARTGCSRSDIAVQGPRPARRRRRAAVRRAAQGDRSRSGAPTSTCSRSRRRRSRARSRCRSPASATSRSCNTPPEDRQPILTYVGEYDERAVSGGDPARAAARGPGALRAQPRARHRARRRRRARARARSARRDRARADGRELGSSGSCSEFWEREHDVLVCTTIVESGLDMPTVNTLVVDRADMLGLAQLYQLRGRVGRRGQRAYAYLLYPARPSRSPKRRTSG